MRLPVRVIESFEDATLNFERIESVFSGPQAEPLAYLQLLSAQRLQIAVGVATFTWPGGSPYSSNTVISHGLGRVPALAGGLAGQSPSGGAAFPFLNAAPSSTQITLAAYSPTTTPTAGQQTTMAWWVIG